MSSPWISLVVSLSLREEHTTNHRIPPEPIPPYSLQTKTLMAKYPFAIIHFHRLAKDLLQMMPAAVQQKIKTREALFAKRKDTAVLAHASIHWYVGQGTFLGADSAVRWERHADC